ncbi:nicotinate (nicotinamide) nucleotide adenylyltransferase [Candidatus Roizmanbacteria bacterium RIFOXYB2_FULL_38_10]|uniref:Probable nicotinate-nucleotide adenylyltransferase n=1 Tax=Candidatus Roizmanbacteria bacterium RIFOXYD1_FULL_38_12 TaxID=1802093 RepID=A0A1F7L0Q4_9BACT|nr:MAG: nicotinate (nicotinamide) nucleotide adenylyltransferase [Candidatus Roizmanbacteria bacterium RIFOXYA2_FULL_38_14]OGK63688.1 MAG: nicotinate (nicotinamide) nucleotide adenylyltransferase [Candidatus Roizmanbacteria bacterium RIFOXYA1_FULL_37_12]OGK65534.1 MAG: nicotinate (nicotinamide) nucleotide adenylyltransferase [Candidatus Roizmanbacteria bacterium RIFOXYB1_FULL_40_23]OGK68318.1 MAG: nicotinate (nicotinamide) nucleotide adenylyltransferase [Candidatus Roizmanbacteria bacterium RIFO
MNIAILGGAFDPPHIGHLFVASQVKELLSMDEVWLMPCYSYFPEFPVKFSHITSPHMRADMVSLLSGQGLRISRFEFDHNKKSRTIDTMRLLKKQYPNDTFSFIIGSDTLPTFRLWNEWNSLVHDYNLIVFPRDTDLQTLEERVKLSFGIDLISSNISIIKGDVIVSNIASTHIRKRVRHNLSIRSMVLPEIEKYIFDHNLYK